MGKSGICDFVFGNPHDMAIPEYVDAIRRASVPLDPSWFAYKLNEPAACATAARSLNDRLGMAFEDADIFMTKGASSALAIVLTAVLDPGDEVIFQSPPWFYYEPMIAFTRGIPIRVRVDPRTFDLDVDAIAAALSPRTRAVIVNSPNNPTGKIYPKKTLVQLGNTLQAASEDYGRAIYLVSDEAYNRIIFDERKFFSPTAYYPYSFLVYSYAKALLTPGQRLGYIALPPSMPGREHMRDAILATQFSGYGVPDAVLQHALPDLEPLCIDIPQLQRRRDLMATELGRHGYDVCLPEGAFYLLVRSPLSNDATFVKRLAADDVFVLPGHIVDMPGYFRICLTANDQMVERSLARFASAIQVTEQKRMKTVRPGALTIGRKGAS